MAYVELHELRKVYPTPDGGEAVIVDGFNLNMDEGEFVAVIGHSGCGKTTVLNMVAGLNPKTSGSAIVGNREVTTAGPDRAVVFQAPTLLPWMSAYGNVMLGVKRVYPTATRQERKQIVEYYMNLVGLYDARHKYPSELSGGMQQRVGIARAIALKPKMLLLDEPFGKLDSLTRMELQDMVMKLVQDNKMTAMMITHDVDEAIFLSDRIVMMTNGPAARVGQILDIPFAHPRDREEMLDDPTYYDLRGQLLKFLEEQDHKKGIKAKEQQQQEEVEPGSVDSVPEAVGHIEPETEPELTHNAA